MLKTDLADPSILAAVRSRHLAERVRIRGP